MTYTKEDLMYACRHYKARVEEGDIISACKQFAVSSFMLSLQYLEDTDAAVVRAALCDLTLHGEFRYSDKSAYREQKIAEMKKEIERLGG